ncbi:MAG: hypothetical protein V3W18_05625 [candidate division Zixibacteria bacterium]
MKISAIVLAIIVIVPVIFVLGLRLYYSDSRLRSIVEDKLGEGLESHVSIGDLEIDGWLGLRLENLVLRETEADSTWMEINEIQIDFAPGEIISRNARFREISVRGGSINYGLIPAFDTSAGSGEETDDFVRSPLKVLIDTFSLTGFRITGPEIDFMLDLDLDDIVFSGIDDYSFSYDIKTDSGRFHYFSNTLSARSDFEFSADGFISDSVSASQRIDFNLANIKIGFPEEYIIGDFRTALLATTKPESSKIVIDSVGFSLNSRSIIDFEGDIEFAPRQRLKLDASGTVWRVSDFADLANRLDIPLKPTGDVLLSEGRLVYTSSGIIYDFTLDISRLGFEFGEELKVAGINGQIFSDGDLGQIIFGSSLTVDSLIAVSPDGSTVRLKGISSAVEAEISESDYSLNITSGIVDFLGGRLDFSAFSENSRVSGELRVSDLDLARVSSGGTGLVDTTVFGLLDLTVDIGGDLDSVSTIFRADAENVIVITEEDTLRLGDQGLEINSVTLLGDENIKTSLDYTIGPLITGEGEIEYPLGQSGGDSLVISYDMEVDNSLLPSYFPTSLARAIGDIDISGISNLTGRLTSHPDSIALMGSSDLSVHSTDLLVEDFRSLLFQLVSVSEVEIAPESVLVSFRGNIAELYAEEYSDLPFPDVRFEGKMASKSDTTWELLSFVADIPSINSKVTAYGEFGIIDGVDYSNFNLKIDFQSDEPVAINSMISVNGKIYSEVTIKQLGEVLKFDGTLGLDNVTLTSVNDFYCVGLKGDFPYSGSLNLSDSLFVKRAGEATINRSTFRRNRRAEMESGYGTITAEIVSFGDIASTNLSIALLFRDGVLEIPSLTGELLGGNLGGGIRLDLTDMNMLREYPDYENIRYELSLETANLDFNQLVYGFGPHADKANLTSAAYFSGRGIVASGEDYDIEGLFHISRMGPQVIDRILDFIDPENQNPGVVQTRSLLNKKLLGFINVSYKPEEFIVEIKHNSLYPGLYMSQPFYANLIPLMRIPMPIRYGRIPLDVILAETEENR